MLSASILKKFPGTTVNVEFKFEDGILVLFGPSGSGKTTVLNCLAGLLKPDRGDISLGGRLFFSSAANIDIPVRKRRTGYVFQHYALFPHMTVKDNVLYGVPGRHKMKVKDRFRMSVLEVLDMLKITRLQDRYPSELSAADHAMCRELRDELKQLQRIWRIPFILVTHSREEMKILADKVLFMKSGKRTGHINFARGGQQEKDFSQ